MMQHWGATKERILVNLTTDAKKVKNLGERPKRVVRNFARGIQNIFEGIQEPRWPRASNSLCTPLPTSRYFWPILTSSPVTLCHTSQDPQKYVTHLGSPILSRPSTKSSDKIPLYKFYLNGSRGFCPGVLSEGLLSERLYPGWFLSVPLLSKCICYNRKLNITLNFRFHIYEKKL